MQKLFVLLRQGNIEEVKRIIEMKPQLLNSISGPNPKKDRGQSLLQVALKSGHFDIAEYLIDKGIDVDFMEEEDDDPGIRVPVLFDAIMASIDSLCINQFASQDVIKERFRGSDMALKLLSRIISSGADVNKRSSNGMSAMNWALHHAEQIMRNPEAYPFSQEKVREQLTRILDLLIDHGTDLKAWRNEGTYPEPSPGTSAQLLYFAEEDPHSGINYDAVREMRNYIRSYFRNRRLLQ
ncbi:MAG: ankyrin repeat domain-containing protein [Oscillospiraceae bacterium]|nr:ankyrin repeat domain-containing protein [Oscillospiraceae bacterium]